MEYKLLFFIVDLSAGAINLAVDVSHVCSYFTCSSDFHTLNNFRKFRFSLIEMFKMFRLWKENIYCSPLKNLIDYFIA